IRAARERLILTHGREPVLSELADATGLTAEEIAQAELATGNADSLNRETSEDGGTLEEMLGDAGIEDAILEHVALSEAMSHLPEREQMILALRFFKGLTQDKTAKIMNISQVQVSRIERSALIKLREFV
ncbi:MAG: sigma-70 family RNA polymerase sigma factor, partial [Clostridia bacterium]